MTYRVEITDKARRSLSRLPRDVQVKLGEQIASLADDPRPFGAKKIKGQKDCYRIRQGNYRVVYAVFDDVLFVLVARAGHRSEVYGQMENVAKIVERFRKREG